MRSLMLVVLLGCVVAAMADHHSCGTLQRLKVKQQWSHAFGHGDSRIDFGIALWRAIFNQEPSYRALFKQVGGDDETSPAFIAHSQRVLGGLDMVISLLDQADTANAQLAHLKHQHDARGIPVAAYGVLKNAALATIGAQLGRCGDKEAWSACFDFIAEAIHG